MVTARVISEICRMIGTTYPNPEEELERVVTYICNKEAVLLEDLRMELDQVLMNYKLEKLNNPQEGVLAPYILLSNRAAELNILCERIHLELESKGSLQNSRVDLIRSMIKLEEDIFKLKRQFQREINIIKKALTR